MLWLQLLRWCCPTALSWGRYPGVVWSSMKRIASRIVIASCWTAWKCWTWLVDPSRLFPKKQNPISSHFDLGVTHFYLFIYCCPPGAQGFVDWHSSPKYGGGTLQFASFPGACPIPVWNWIPQGVWRPQNRGTGAKYMTVWSSGTNRLYYCLPCDNKIINQDCRNILNFVVTKHLFFPPTLQVQKLQAILKPMMLRRLKEDVEKNLAPKQETIIEVPKCF